MVRRLLTPLLILVLAAAPAVAGEKKCSVAARKCENQIREMLRGRRWLGVEFEKTRFGIMIRGVVPGSPAQEAGFLVDDQILAVNGRDMSHAEIQQVKQSLQEARRKTDGKLNVVVTRYGHIRRVHARLGELPKEHVDKVVEAHLREAHGGDGK